MVDTNGCGDLHENSFVNKHTTSSVGLASDQINWAVERATEFKKYSGAPISVVCHIQPEVFADAMSKYGFPADVSAYGSECSEFSIILAKGNVMYLKDVTIS